MDDIDYNLLPGILQEIADLIGIPATMAIVEEYGGVRLYVPMKVTPDHPLSQLIGQANAEKLADHFGGEDHFDIPKAKAALRAIRDKEIRSLWPTLSQRQLALKYQTTERNIRLILSGIEQNKEQPQLF